MRGSSRGFTQMEVLICIGIASVLAALSIPRATAWGDTARAHGAAWSLATALRQVRARALRSGATLTVRFDPTTANWETRNAAGAVLDTNPLPPRLRFGSLPQSQQLHFGATGRSDNGTIALSCGTSSARVVVNQRGRVRIG